VTGFANPAPRSETHSDIKFWQKYIYETVLEFMALAEQENKGLN